MRLYRNLGRWECSWLTDSWRMVMVMWRVSRVIMVVMMCRLGRHSILRKVGVKSEGIEWSRASTWRKISGRCRGLIIRLVVVMMVAA